MGHNVYSLGLVVFNNSAKKFPMIALEHLINHATIMRIFFLYFLDLISCNLSQIFYVDS